MNEVSVSTYSKGILPFNKKIHPYSVLLEIKSRPVSDTNTLGFDVTSVWQLLNEVTYWNSYIW